MSKLKTHKIVICDDHVLFASSLERLINSYDEFEVLFHAKNGLELQRMLESATVLPDIILLDMKMPVMDGYDTIQYLTPDYPDIKVLSLSVENDEKTILKMIRGGVKGYFLKDIHPDDLKFALMEVLEKGYYYTQMVTDTMVKGLKPTKKDVIVNFKDKELIFMQHACSEMTYKEIADQMSLSPKTIDGYRQELFYKLRVKNRVGLVLYGLKNGLIEI